MAKAKDKKSSGKSSSKSKKASGAKLPKSVRKSGIMEMINTSLGREILADALIAAAGAAAAALTRTRTAKRAGAAVVDAGSQAADTTQTAAGAVATVVTEAARHFLPPALVGGDETEKGGKAPEKTVKYVQRSSDHSARKTTSKAKGEKGDKAQGS